MNESDMHPTPIDRTEPLPLYHTGSQSRDIMVARRRLCLLLVVAALATVASAATAAFLSPHAALAIRRATTGRPHIGMNALAAAAGGDGAEGTETEEERLKLDAEARSRMAEHVKRVEAAQ